MEVDTDRCLDRAYEVLERLRDCGLAPCELSDEAALLSRSPAGVHVRASAAALAAALLALSPPLLGAPEPLQAAAAAVRATAADDLSAADGALEHALAGLLGALDPQDQAAPQTERAELFGTCRRTRTMRGRPIARLAASDRTFLPFLLHHRCAVGAPPGRPHAGCARQGCRCERG